MLRSFRRLVLSARVSLPALEGASPARAWRPVLRMSAGGPVVGAVHGLACMGALPVALSWLAQKAPARKMGKMCAGRGRCSAQRCAALRCAHRGSSITLPCLSIMAMLYSPCAISLLNAASGVVWGGRRGAGWAFMHPGQGRHSALTCIRMGSATGSGASSSAWRGQQGCIWHQLLCRLHALALQSAVPAALTVVDVPGVTV